MDDTGDVEEGGWGDDDALGGDEDDDEAGSEGGAGKGEAGGGWGDSDDDLDLPPGVATNEIIRSVIKTSNACFYKSLPR